MTSKKEMLDIAEKTKFITRAVRDLSLDERRYILQIITNSSIESEKIQEKGNGIQIKFRDIPIQVITDVHDYIKKLISTKEETLKNRTEENEILSDAE